MRTAAITGTTTGLGSALVNIFLQYMNVDTFSRTNGYDIHQQFPIVEHCRRHNIDTFINNAYSGQAQSQLLLKLAMACPQIHIISIGSVSRYRTDADTVARIEYATDKAHLYETHGHLHRMGKRTTYIDLGMVDTAYNKNKSGPKLYVSDVAKIILDIAQAGYNKEEHSYYCVTPDDTNQLQSFTHTAKAGTPDRRTSRDYNGSRFPSALATDPLWTGSAIGYTR